MRAKGRSPTSAIAPPASIENHAGGQSPSPISIKLLGCQQSQVPSMLCNISNMLVFSSKDAVLNPSYPQKSLTLLLPPRHRLIDARGAAGGDVASEQCDTGKQNRDGSKRERIGRANSVNQSGYEAGEANRSGDSDADADQRDLQSLSQHHPQDVSSGRAKRHANSNFVRALAGQIGNHAVDSDRGKNKSKRGEYAEEKHGQPLRRD